jgi:hypothetical protein
LKAFDADTLEIEAEKHPFYTAIVYLANQYLITDDGHPDVEAIIEVNTAGFNVRPGETDSFGWLTGIITTQKAEIVFG